MVRFAIAFGLLIIAAFSRFLPHPPNFSPILAVAIFVGALVPSVRVGLALTLGAVVLSDLLMPVLGGAGVGAVAFYDGVIWVYAGYLFAVVIGRGPAGQARNVSPGLASAAREAVTAGDVGEKVAARGVLPIVSVRGVLPIVSARGVRDFFSATRLTILGGTLGSVAFFGFSNFGVWASTGLYAKTWEGLVQCYVMALPFFHQTLISTVGTLAVLSTASAAALVVARRRLV